MRTAFYKAAGRGIMTSLEVLWEQERDAERRRAILGKRKVLTFRFAYVNNDIPEMKKIWEEYTDPEVRRSLLAGYSLFPGCTERRFEESICVLKLTEALSYTHLDPHIINLYLPYITNNYMQKNGTELLTKLLNLVNTDRLNNDEVKAALAVAKALVLKQAKPPKIAPRKIASDTGKLFLSKLHRLWGRYSVVV